MRARWYTLNGRVAVPIDFEDMLALGPRLEDTHRSVARDEIADVCVSTVFLGLDHQWGDGPPLIFETMVFGGEHDECQWRYSTWEEAEAGHANVVELVRIETKNKANLSFEEWRAESAKLIKFHQQKGE